VDIVAKNGNLLLNVPQKPDGTLDEETLFTLKRIGAWLKDNGEGIYGSRPNAKYREGATELEGGPFKGKEKPSGNPPITASPERQCRFMLS